MKPNLEKRAEDFQKNPTLILCNDYGCVERGEFIKCYSDKYKECKLYKKER